jgi:hypothetical protein
MAAAWIWLAPGEALPWRRTVAIGTGVAIGRQVPAGGRCWLVVALAPGRD